MESADFIAIHNLMGRYGHIMDECSMAGGPWDRLGEIFTVDATFDVRRLGGPLLSSLKELKAAWGAASCSSPKPRLPHSPTSMATVTTSNAIAAPQANGGS